MGESTGGTEPGSAAHRRTAALKAGDAAPWARAQRRDARRPSQAAHGLALQLYAPSRTRRRRRRRRAAAVILGAGALVGLVAIWQPWGTGQEQAATAQLPTIPAPPAPTRPPTTAAPAPAVPIAVAILPVPEPSGRTPPIPAQRPAVGPAGAVDVPAPVLAAIQEHLAALAFSPGNTAGTWDSATAEAVAAYRETAGLPGTGPDRRLLRELRAVSPIGAADDSAPTP